LRFPIRLALVRHAERAELQRRAAQREQEYEGGVYRAIDESESEESFWGGISDEEAQARIDQGLPSGGYASS
jgi:hypothetical protein